MADLLHCFFPRWPEIEVPIGHVTNGVHVPSWDSAAADELWTSACGRERWRGTMEAVAADIRCVSDAALWQLRATARQALIGYARERLVQQLAASGASTAQQAQARQVFDPNALTLGFARRFATYKRSNLLLHDPERLSRMLTDPRRPVQLIIAGKAHPQDREGQAMVQAWVHFIRERPEIRPRVIFLSDYDMLLAEHLVQGVDVWINTPRRPWEASGTSGMKVLVNGGLNLSELDGWWAEADTPEVGWALGDGQEHDDPAWDAAEAEALYTLLEQEVIPLFYTRNAHGIPINWVVRLQESTAQLTPRFSANSNVRAYAEQYYLAAAMAYRKRAAHHGELG
jgi:starch phosphorylase